MHQFDETIPADGELVQNKANDIEMPGGIGIGCNLEVIHMAGCSCPHLRTNGKTLSTFFLNGLQRTLLSA